MTVWDAIRALRRHGLLLKRRGETWVVGRRYGAFFAITASFSSLVSLGEWIEAL